MVGLLGLIFNPWSKPTWFKICLEARHIACLTIVHLICAKVQIPGYLFENDSHIHEMSSFKWYY